MVKARPASEIALLDALRRRPGSVRTLRARIGRFSVVALRQALGRLVDAGSVVVSQGAHARVYRLSENFDPDAPCGATRRLSDAQIRQLERVAAAGTGLPDGGGVPRRLRLALEEAGFVHRKAVRPPGARRARETRWFVTQAGTRRLEAVERTGP